jgi:hypothetical protein
MRRNRKGAATADCRRFMTHPIVDPAPPLFFNFYSSDPTRQKQKRPIPIPNWLCCRIHYLFHPRIPSNGQIIKSQKPYTMHALYDYLKDRV